MSFIYVPFSYLMKGCLWLAGDSYVFALLFFALAVQVLMIPLYIKQQKAQIASAKVRPMEMAIREKYKGRTDRATMQKMNMEIQEMYQKNGHSQFAGCLPMLIQLPLLLILYAIVRQPISYASNLTDKDPAFLETNLKAAVEFYQAEKEALIKDSYETAEEYNKAVSELEGNQVYLGGAVKKEGENEVTTETGMKVYEFSKPTGGMDEIYLANLIVDGGERVDSLIEQKHLPADFASVYGDYGFENYKEDLPNFHIFGLNILNTPDFGSNAWLLFVPLLVFLTQFAAMKINRKFVPAVPGPDGKPIGGGLFMEVGMPLLSAFFAFKWPAAMGVYWIWRTLLDIVKSFIFAKAMPIPQVTQEQIDAAKKQLKGSASQKRKKQITIEVDEDDDSYDDLVVKRGESGAGASAPNRPRRVEMLTADEDEIPRKPEKEEPESDAAEGSTDENN